jgi:hypothetical protein
LLVLNDQNFYSKRNIKLEFVVEWGNQILIILSQSVGGRELNECVIKI